MTSRKVVSEVSRHGDIYNDPHRVNRHNRVTITLDCGCKLKVKTRPMSKNTRYPCPSGQGHGYNVIWRTWEEGNTRGDND